MSGGHPLTGDQPQARFSCLLVPPGWAATKHTVIINDCDDFPPRQINEGLWLTRGKRQLESQVKGTEIQSLGFPWCLIETFQSPLKTPNRPETTKPLQCQLQRTLGLIRAA